MVNTALARNMVQRDGGLEEGASTSEKNEQEIREASLTCVKILDNPA